MGATYFFRDTQTLKMIPSTLIPLILKGDGCKSRENINIWSAGCANGSEPYTLAIILKDILDEEIFSRIRIYATDIDPNNRFENILKKGSYPQEDLKKIPEKMFLSNFLKDPDIQGNYYISEQIRKHVIYSRHNLLSLRPVIESPFDVIVCKNVLLHYT
jgi:chemotaxis methyl-accepting protein methylase